MKTVLFLVFLLPVLVAQQCKPACRRDILLTEAVYTSDQQAKAGCLACNMQLCTLFQMKVAFEFGYRNLEFGFYSGGADRKARVSSCDYDLTGQECFYEDREIITVPKVAGEELGAYCCPLTYLIVTPKTFSTHLSARHACRNFGFDLCPLVKLAYINDRGYNTDKYGWFENENLQVILRSDGVQIRHTGPSADEASSAYCIPITSAFVLSKASYDTHGEARAFCRSVQNHLCSLAELKAARDNGYWSDVWGYYEVEGRNVKVFDCKSWRGSECYEGVIANTPRPAGSMRAYCCP